MTRRPSEQCRRTHANRYLMTSALDSFQNFERTIGLHIELVDTLKLVENPEPLSDQLHGGARAPRSRFPTAEYKQARAIEPGDALDGFRREARPWQCASAKPLALESTATNSKLTLCAIVIITCWSFAFGPTLTSQTLLPAKPGRQVGGFIQCMCRPRIQDGRKHHFVLQRGSGWGRDRLQRLQGIWDNAPAHYDLISVCHSSPF